MQLDLKKLRIDIIIIIGFAVLSLAYCFPQLQGKKLNQHDNISWQGMAREAMAYHDSTGKDALWSNSMFGGMPTYTTYIGATNTNYPVYIQVLLESMGKPAYFFFIAMLCFYILMRVLGVNMWVSILGSIAYAFSSYNPIIIGVGHETKMLTLGYMPAALAGLYLIFKEKWLTGAALFALAVTLIFDNNHFQVIYYFAIMFGCFGLAMLTMFAKNGMLGKVVLLCAIAAIIAVLFAGSDIKYLLIIGGCLGIVMIIAAIFDRRYVPFLIVIGAAVIAVGPSASSIMTTAEYTKETMRGGASELSGHDKKASGGLDKEYAFRWSNGIGETFCLMIPYLYGGSSGETADKAPKTLEAIGGNAESLPLYWGPQPFLGGPVYFGAVVCFLFILGLLVVRSPHKWWILAASLVGIIMSWGKNFDAVNYFLFDHLPMLNKFRTPSMALVIPEFLFPLLGVWAVQAVIDRKDDPKTWSHIKIAAGVTAGLCLLLGVGGSMFFNFSGGEDAQLPKDILKLLREDRASLAMTSGIKSAAYILASAALLWAFIKNKIKLPVLVAGVAVIMLVDLVPVAYDYLNDKSYVDASEYESLLEPRPVDKQILADKDPYYRVLDLSKDTYNDAVQAYFHKCIGGYHPAKMEIYQDLIDRQMSRGFNGQVLNMLNTKYIIVGRKGGQPGVIPNPTACGNAWFVNEVKWANTADDEMNGLNAPGIGDTTVMPNAFDPKKTAVMRTTFKDVLGNYTFGKDSAASVKLARYGLDEISFTSNNSRPGLAVFSDIYYAMGWKAFVDGNETPIMRADYVLRAIKVPQGAHSIEFRFHPDSFYKGQKISFASSILLILLFVAALFPLLKKGKTEQA